MKRLENKDGLTADEIIDWIDSLEEDGVDLNSTHFKIASFQNLEEFDLGTLNMIEVVSDD